MIIVFCEFCVIVFNKYAPYDRYFILKTKYKNYTILYKMFKFLWYAPGQEICQLFWRHNRHFAVSMKKKLYQPKVPKQNPFYFSQKTEK